VMPKLNTGELWEQNYRYAARQIIKGLRISANGRNPLKATQIYWKRFDTESTRKEYACSNKLPWKEDAVETNLAFIKEAVERSLNEPRIPFRQHLNSVLDGFTYTPLSTSSVTTPLQNEPILTELRLIRNYLEKLTLLQEVSNG